MDDVFAGKKPDMVVYVMAMGQARPIIQLNSAPLLQDAEWLYALVGLQLIEELRIETPDVTDIGDRWGALRSAVAIYAKGVTSDHSHFEVLKPGITVTIKNGVITYG